MPSGPPLDSEPALEVRSLTRRFGRRTAVDGVTFRVEPASVFGLLGPNGSGKTTTLACALGLLEPTRGEARVLGRPARSIARTRGRVGVVFDGAHLVNGLSVVQNLRYAQRLLGHREGRSEAEALALAGLEGFERRRVTRLSLGERKRVAVARALLGAPDLIVLDEPLAALDPLGVEAMLALLRRLAQEGTTLVVSSHRLHEMERVITHAAILSRGRLVARGALPELLAEHAGRLRLRATPIDRAREVCERHPAVSEVRGAGDELELTLATNDPTERAALNAALVEAGCAVSALVPEASDLRSLFARRVGGEAPE